MKRLSYLIAAVFVFALISQLALMAATATHPSTSAPAKPAKGATVQVVSVALTDNMIMLKPAMVKAGKVRFDIKNTGKKAHGFEVTAKNMTKKISDIKPGKTHQLTVNLKTGKYTVMDPMNANVKGMKATLTVK